MPDIDGGIENNWKIFPGYNVGRFMESVSERIKLTPNALKRGLQFQTRESLKSENISKVITTLDEVLYNAQQMKSDLGINKINAYIEGLIDEVSEDHIEALTYQRLVDIDISKIKDNRTITRDLITRHSVETAILATLAAIEINREYLSRENNWIYTREDFKNIVRGSLLHDVGKISTEMVNLWTLSRKLVPNERKRMEKHTEYGRQILEKCNEDVSDKILTIVEDHHEKANGSGYNGKIIDDLDPLAALVGATDRFGAMNIARRRYRRDPVANFWNAYAAELYGCERVDKKIVIERPGNYPNDKFGMAYEAFRRLFNNSYSDPTKDFYEVEFKRV